jgi:hypothetical protein
VVVIRRLLRSPYLLPVLTLAAVGVLLVDPVRRSDLMVFLRAAHDVSHGVNPYTPTDDPFLWGGSAYVYPYLTAFIFVPLTVLPVPVADVLWFSACGAAVIAGCRVLGLRDPLGISLVLASSTCIRSFQVGAINTVLFLGAALAWRYRERVGPLALSVTLVAGSKLFLLPVTVWVLLTRSRTAVVATAASLGAFLGLSLLLQPISLAEFLRSMSLLAEHEGLQGMSATKLVSAVLPEDVARALPLAVAAAVLLGGAAFRALDPARGDRVLFSAAVVASMIATPVYWSHYTVIVLVVLLVSWPTRRTAVLFALASWVVSRPIGVSPAHQLDLTPRLVLLFGGMLAVLLAVARSGEPDRVVLDDRVREQDVRDLRGLLQSGIRRLRLERELDVAPDPERGRSREPEVRQGVRDGLSLRVEDLRLEHDVDDDPVHGHASQATEAPTVGLRE